MSTNMSLRVKLKLVCPCRMLTSDRHAEEGNPKYTNRKKKRTTKKPDNPLRTSQVHKHQSPIKPAAAAYSQNGNDFSQTSSCIFYCYFLLWFRIPALLKWNHLNPVGPPFVIAEGFSTRAIGGGFVYTHARLVTLSLLHVFPSRVCSGSVTKKVAYYHPPEELSAHVRFGNCCRITSRLNWT